MKRAREYTKEEVAAAAQLELMLEGYARGDRVRSKKTGVEGTVVSVNFGSILDVEVLWERRTRDFHTSSDLNENFIRLPREDA